MYLLVVVATILYFLLEILLSHRNAKNEWKKLAETLALSCLLSPPVNYHYQANPRLTSMD